MFHKRPHGKSVPKQICITKSPNNDKQAKSIKNSSEILHIASNNNQRKLGSKK